MHKQGIFTSWHWVLCVHWIKFGWVLLASGPVLFSVMAPSHANTMEPEYFKAELLVEKVVSRPSNQQMQAGITQVLLRLLGREALLQEPAAKSLILEAKRYLIRFYYQHDEQLLTMHYDGHALIQQLRLAQLPVWPVPRSKVMLWWAFQEAGRPLAIIQDTDEDDKTFALRSQATARGLPIELPMMDLADQRQMNAETLLSWSEAAAARATERYQLSHWVMGFAKPVNQQGRLAWQGRWLLNMGDEAFWFDAQQTSQSALMIEVVNLIAEFFANQSALPIMGVGEGGDYRLRVNQITDYSSFVALRQHLIQYPGIEQVQLAVLNERYVELTLQLNMPAIQLEEQLSQDQRFQQQQVPLAPVMIDPAAVDSSLYLEPDRHANSMSDELSEPIPVVSPQPQGVYTWVSG